MLYVVSYPLAAHCSTLTRPPRTPLCTIQTCVINQTWGFTHFNTLYRSPYLLSRAWLSRTLRVVHWCPVMYFAPLAIVPECDSRMCSWWPALLYLDRYLHPSMYSCSHPTRHPLPIPPSPAPDWRSPSDARAHLVTAHPDQWGHDRQGQAPLTCRLLSTREVHPLFPYLS